MVKNSVKSNWVRRELSSTISSSISNSGDPRIIPIVLDKTPLPMLLRDILYIEYCDGIERDRTAIIKAITGEIPSDNYIKSIVKKYNEVIFAYDGNEPLPFKACPECGSTQLKKYMVTDHKRDENYFFVKCLECGWNEWTQ